MKYMYIKQTSLFHIYILRIEGHNALRYSVRNEFVLSQHANFRIMVSRHTQRGYPGFMKIIVSNANE